jgi:hypothetical protein
MALPSDLAISGSFLGPMTISAIARIKSNSGIPIPNMTYSSLPEIYTALQDLSENYKNYPVFSCLLLSLLKAYQFYKCYLVSSRKPT